VLRTSGYNEWIPSVCDQVHRQTRGTRHRWNAWRGTSLAPWDEASGNQLGNHQGGIVLFLVGAGGFEPPTP
jgi:hypothetical protein